MADLFFSVVIPLYNKEDTVKDAVLSVLSQSHGHFELIIVDDGSDDGSLNIVRGIGDRRIKIVEKKNEGVSVARNTGIEYASSEYICFLDADDIWCSNYLEVVASLIRKYPGAGAYATNILFDYGSARRAHLTQLLPEDFVDGVIDNYFRTFVKGKSLLMSSNICIKKEVFDCVGRFEPHITLTEDSELWCRIAKRFEVVFSSTICVVYRIEKKIPTINRVHYIVESLQRQLDNGEFSDEDASYVMLIIEYQLIVSALFYLLNNKNKRSRAILSDKRIKHFRLRKALIWVLSYMPSFLVVFVYQQYKKVQ